MGDAGWEIWEGAHGKRRRRLMNEGKIRNGKKLAVWSFEKVRALGVEENVAVFWNSFWDLFNEVEERSVKIMTSKCNGCLCCIANKI